VFHKRNLRFAAFFDSFLFFPSKGKDFHPEALFLSPLSCSLRSAPIAAGGFCAFAGASTVFLALSAATDMAASARRLFSGVKRR
jgi:hypothetical protein